MNQAKQLRRRSKLESRIFFAVTIHQTQNVEILKSEQ